MEKLDIVPLTHLLQSIENRHRQNHAWLLLNLLLTDGRLSLAHNMSGVFSK